MADFSRRCRRDVQGSKIPLLDVLLFPDEDNELTSFESEVKEWAEVNRRLRCNGFPKVKLLHPEDVNLCTDRVVCFDLATSESLRETLNSLMQGSDASVQNKYKTKIKDLKIMLECSRARVKELENELEKSSSLLLNNQHSEKNDSPECLKKKFDLQLKEKNLQIDMLQRKIHKLCEDENKRQCRQNHVFQEFRKRTAKAHSAMDEKLLDVIDSYERQVCTLQKELEKYKKGEQSSSSFYDEEFFPHHSDASSNIKGLIKTYEKQLHECQKRMNLLEQEKENLLLELGGKTDIKEYRRTDLRMKKLEKLLAQHNISIPGEKLQKDPYRLRRNYSTRAEELDSLPLDCCHRFLKGICTELSLDDVNKIIPYLQDLKDDVKNGGMYEEFCRRIHEIVQNVQSHSRSKRPNPKRHTLSERHLQCDLEILENWKQDIAGLQDLQRVINTIVNNLAPWAKVHFTEDHSVCQMVNLLDSLAFEERGVVRKRHISEQLSRTQMENIISHFQTLFDVPASEGIYPRMNEVYTKLGEVYNVIHTLKNLLGLPEDVNCAKVVDAVGRLCESHNTTTIKQLQQLLQTNDLDGVIRRLDEHAQFFPAFKQIMVKLMEILEIERVDQVLPAVRALKMLSC